MVMVFLTRATSPNNPPRPTPVRCSTASRSALLGMVPVLTVAPPSTLFFSMMTTDLPSLAAWIAAFCPAGPVPITAMSKCRMIFPGRRGRKIPWFLSASSLPAQHPPHLRRLLPRHIRHAGSAVGVASLNKQPIAQAVQIGADDRRHGPILGEI